MDRMWVAGLLLGMLPLLMWVLRSFNEWRFCRPFLRSRNGAKLPPGQLGWPIIGELLDFLWHFKFAGTPDEFIWKREAKYGDTGIYRTHLFGYPTIISCSPEANRYVMTTGTEDGSFIAGWPAPVLLGPNSISMVDGDHHKRLRRHLLQATNRPDSLRNLFDTLQPVFKDVFQNWVLKGTITAADEVRALTLRNICALLFGFEKGPLLDTMKTITRGLLQGVRANPINIPGTAFHYAVKCRKRLTAIVFAEIQQRKANKECRKADFFQDLMDSVDSNGDILTEEEVVDTATSLILGGYESTACSMTWALYYLCKYPNVLTKLREENRGISEKKGDDKFLTFEDKRKMSYTCKVIDEVVRLANVANFMFRTVAKEEVKFNGYTFPKGWKVAVWLRTIHVDPRYFKDPQEFNPDRWDEFKPMLGVYNVFGCGPRQCPGNNFARMQLLMFLHHLSLDYKWEIVNSEEAIKYLPNPIQEEQMV